jgi:hypothetical protein
VFSYTSDVPLNTLVTWLASYATWSEVYAALLHCKSQHVLFQNRFGQSSEIATVGNRVVLVPPATPPGTEMLATFYREGLITVKTTTFQAWAQKIRFIETDATTLEAAVLAGAPVPRAFVNFYYEFKVPKKELSIENVKYAPGAVRRGRKATKPVLRDEPLGPEAEEGPETVRVHTLNTIPANVKSTNAVTMYEAVAGPLRILDSGSTSWRDPSPSETVVYTALIQGRIRRQLEAYERTGLYGSVYGDNAFRIRDMRKERTDITDKRKLGRGKMCDPASFSEDQLKEYIQELGGTMPPPGSNHAKYCSAVYSALEKKGRLFILRPE